MPKRKAATSLGYKNTKKPTKKAKSTFIKLKPEIKAFDVAIGESEFSPSGHFELLNVPIQGQDRFERIGRKIANKSIHVTGLIRVLTAGASMPNDFLRLMLVWDKQPNAAVPLGSDLLTDSNAIGLNSVLSHVNLNNRERFIVLRDKRINWPVYDGTAFSTSNQMPYLDPQLNIDWFVSLKGMETTFNGINGQTPADIETGALYLYTQNYDAVNANLISLTYTSRHRYFDN